MKTVSIGGLVAALSLLSGLAAQTPAPAVKGVLIRSSAPPPAGATLRASVVRTAAGVTIVPNGTTAATAPQGAGEAPKPPSPKLQKLQQLTFDRRPSAILEAWAKKDLEPLPEEPPADADAAAESTPSASEPTTPEAAPVEDAPMQEEAFQDDVSVEEPMLVDVTPDAMPDVAPGEAAAATPVSPAATASPDPAEAAKQAKKAAWDQKRLQRELEIYQRDVTLGRWERVKTFLAGMDGKEGDQAFEHLCKALVNPPPPAPPANQIPPQFQEKNEFSFEDILGLAAAAPGGIDKDQIALLGPLLQRALDGGHALQELLTTLQQEIAKPPEQRALDRRGAALLLAAIHKDTEMGAFLPPAKVAIEQQDREALNLLARHYLATYAKDKHDDDLENAWDVTQGALAIADTEAKPDSEAGKRAEKEKQEALRRAVDLAPKVRDELGQAWLEESFTSQPRRGMEILAAIGSAEARGFQEHARDPAFRQRTLELQKTAVDALLREAPERADEWSETLELLAENWLREAEHSYQYSSATSMGPIARRDSYGNIYWVSNGSGGQNAPVVAIEPGDLLQTQPTGAWAERIDPSVQPSFARQTAQLLLKVNEEERAFPYIAQLAQTHPKEARSLAEEFVRVWTRNHDPNGNSYTGVYMYTYGFSTSAAGIPLTRSKQERNLKELAKWVKKLRALPIEPIDEHLLVEAFTKSHSQAEVYRLETIESVFGDLHQMDPKTLASMLETMRVNLASVWRKPAVQEQAKTRRNQKDIEREVMAGYATAGKVIDEALQKHPGDWALLATAAALIHDQNNYRHEIQPNSDFAEVRHKALAAFQAAAAQYAKAVPDLEVSEESPEVFERWFYAGLGACDLPFLDETTVADHSQPALIKKAIEALPGEAAERNMSRFANDLFTRLSSVNPAVKFRYLEAGFEIVGDHPQAHEAKQVYDYYKDLVTEIQLEAKVDGDAVVGTQPFGLAVDIHHTRQIEKESGGFGKYLTNQNNQPYAYNYGRPTEDYRDKFEEAARKALVEHFEVLSVTFNDEKATSKAAEQYGWRYTPYAYLLLKARGPEVDTVPPLRLDLDFSDNAGYVVLPVESPAVPIVARETPAEPRPFSDLEITQMLDERHADEGELVLEVKATAHGLVPDLDRILTIAPSEFVVGSVDGNPVAVSHFTDDQEGVVSERTWNVKLKARDDLVAAASKFEFGKAKDDATSMVYQRYADADLVSAEPVVDLLERYGSGRGAWPWIVGGVLVLLAGGLGLWFARRRGQRTVVHDRRLPGQITPFTVLGLLRDLERNDGFDEGGRRELRATIEHIEAHYFGNAEEDPLDLRRVAEQWLQRAR